MVDDPEASLEDVSEVLAALPEFANDVSSAYLCLERGDLPQSADDGSAATSTSPSESNKDDLIGCVTRLVKETRAASTFSILAPDSYKRLMNLLLNSDFSNDERNLESSDKVSKFITGLGLRGVEVEEYASESLGTFGSENVGKDANVSAAATVVNNLQGLVRKKDPTPVNNLQGLVRKKSDAVSTGHDAVEANKRLKQ